MLLSKLPENNAIKVGKLWLKPKSLENHVSRSVRMIALHDEDDSLPLGRSGSCTLVKFCNQYFIVATRHELNIPQGNITDDSTLESLIFCTGAEYLENIIVKNCMFEVNCIDEEFHDILVFEVADNWESQIKDSPHFYPLQEFNRKQRQISMAIGCPTLHGVMNYDKNKVDIKTAILNCKFDATFKSKNRYYRRYSYNTQNQHIDGFSGGAVFSLIGETEFLELYFDGIILRAGNGYLHTIDSDFLVYLLSNQK